MILKLEATNLYAVLKQTLI